MNRDPEVLNKILAIKRSHTMIKCDLLQGCKEGSTSTNQSMIHHVNKMRIKIMIISIDAEKNI